MSMRYANAMNLLLVKDTESKNVSTKCDESIL